MARKAKPKAVAAPLPEGAPFEDDFFTDKKFDSMVEKAMASTTTETMADPDEHNTVDANPLVQAARSGDRRALLEALRDHLAVSLATCTSGRDTAALARNLNIVSKELTEMGDPNASENDPLEIMRKKVKDKQCNG